MNSPKVKKWEQSPNNFNPSRLEYLSAEPFSVGTTIHAATGNTYTMSHSILHLSRQLIDGLNSHPIAYCHWKDNHAIMKGLSGDEDLDLLVRKEDFPLFLRTILSLGFKEGHNRKTSYPFIFHFYGLDPETGKLLHLHVYLKIITGESHLKNYNLPLEKMIFENTVSDPSGCKVPIPEVELIIYLIRYYIKISCVPGAILLRRQHTEFSAEFARICRTIDHDKIGRLLKTHVKFIPAELFAEMLANYTEKRPIPPRIFSGLKLRQKLFPLCRFSGMESFVTRYRQIISRLLNKFIVKEKKSLVSGGAIIAITGLDATGKSTLVNEIQLWLGKHFTTRNIHVGRPQTGWEKFLSLPISAVKKMVQSEKQDRTATTKKYGLLYAIRSLIIACERFKILKKANRERSKGRIIICDRYPSLNVGKMDSPRIGEMQESPGLIAKMGRMERERYNSMPVPDVVINLTIPIELAIQRNRMRVKANKENDTQLRERYRENSGLRYNTLSFEEIDTSNDFPLVLKELKEKIWARL